jgi:hypothetical protein
MRRSRVPAVTLCDVSAESAPPTLQLLVYRFGPGADYEGRLVGALERIESGGALRVVDALFAANDPATGELAAISLRAAGSSVAALLSFRLDPAERRKATVRATDPGRSGIAADTMRELAGALEPGHAVAAVLVEHVWSAALSDAVSRSGGTPVSNEFVQATALGDVSPTLLAAVAR